jgi:arylsulfatase A-like enzyme
MRAEGYYTANVREFPAEMNVRGAGKTDWNFIPKETPLFQSDRWADLASHQPFYAQVNFQETHRDFNAEGITDPAKVVLPPYYPDHPVIRKDYADYLDSARRLDGKIAKILARLEKEGLADNTVIIFMGDNGEAHIRGKQFCYEEGLRVPLIIRWPKGIPAPANYRPGTADRRLLEAIDMPATLLHLAGAAA